ncbi:glycine receptor subunit alpha-3-like [Centruroides vittatus]|uniref:glycine receptor subunit alpha-3-like n=1 Tax=Centruroides vittatus TaxID=120091 RepID=UPI0035102F54
MVLAVFVMTFSVTLLFFAIFTSLLVTCLREAEDMKIIPEGYNPDIPPMINNLPSSVYIACQILGIDEINEATMDFHLILGLIAVWKDPRLHIAHLVSKHPVIFPSNLVSKIWKPDLGYPNTKKVEAFEETSKISVVKILSDGSLFAAIRINFLVDCPMELHNYPIDVQICKFYIGLATNTDKEISVEWMGERSSPYRHLGKSIQVRNMHLLKYETDEIKAKKVTQVWVSGNFTVLIAEFKFKRRLTGNLMNVYIPSTLVVMLSWLSFWIDVHAAPARITLGVTSILTLVTHLVQSRSFVPPVDYLKALDIWFIFCIAAIFLSLLEYAFAYQSVITVKEEKEVQTPALESDQKKKKFSTTVKGWMSHLKDIKNTLIVSKHINAYDKVSRYIFPFVFINFVSFYWLYYLGHRYFHSEM